MQKFNNHQFTEIGFIFERDNGSFHSDYENEVIANSELTKIKSSELQKTIVEGINLGIYHTEELRVSAYWALSKTNNKKLILDFRKCLRNEIVLNNGIAVFQILIALDKLDEQPFNKNRNSRGANETKKNIKDAESYLNKNSAQQRV